MADEDLSPLPFRRERNLSNRNFNKRNSRRRLSTEKHTTVQQEMSSTVSATTTLTTEATSTTSTTTTTQTYLTANNEDSSASSSFQLSYSVNSDTENAFNQRSLLKMRTAEEEPTARPDPALLDVRQKVHHFEALKTTIGFIKMERLSLKLLPEQRERSRADMQNKENARNNNGSAASRSPLLMGELRSKLGNRNSNERHSMSSSSVQQMSIDEVRSEDEVDNISDYEAEPSSSAGEYILPELAHEMTESEHPAAVPGFKEHSAATNVGGEVPELGIDDFGKVEVLKRSASAERSVSEAVSADGAEVSEHSVQTRKDFQRNFRSAPRRKTEVIGSTNRNVIEKFHSLYQPKDYENDEEEEIELRDKSDKCVHPILEELIHTEEAYVENLRKGIENYGNIFQRKDLPLGLRGKKYDLMGNIEQIAEFHRDEFLPMLHRNRRDLKRLFDEFQQLIEENCFYGYVVFTMNKQKSLKLCDVYKNYFKLIQTELDDKLGINSFLVQPIQRMARYPLLLTTFINTFFKNRDIVMKPLIESCCRLEKRLRTLLTTTNESEIINDIVDCHDFNVFYQGKFRKVSEFQVFDHTLKRHYRAKVFIFDKCIIYTEIKGKHLVFHGRYPCEHIGITAKTKAFTLYYERRKQQECDFISDPAQIATWLELIRDMISNFAASERVKLQERYSRESDHQHRKVPSLSLYRDSNRFSSDSGIGNIWVMPKPEEEQANNRTTWYATS